MHKPSLFLTVAAGVLASLVLSAPTHAGSVLYTVDTDVVVTAGLATSATVDFSEAVSAPVTIITTTLPPLVAALAPSGASETFTFGSTPPGSYVLDFSIWAPSSPVLDGDGGVVGPMGSAQGGVVVLSISSSTSVPEPASMALLGIGTVGFFAYRRLFKRSAV